MDCRKNGRKLGAWNLVKHVIVLMLVINVTNNKNTSTRAEFLHSLGRNIKGKIELNLSRMNLAYIEPDALVDGIDLKSFDLAYNTIWKLPRYVFRNQGKLEYLNLTHNRLTFGGFYQGLSSLKVLNISDNSIGSFGPGYFFGLPNFTRIITRGLYLSKISVAMFENITESEEPSQEAAHITDGHSNNVAGKSTSTTSGKADNTVAIKMCIKGHHLESVEDIKEGYMPENCIKNYLIDEGLHINRLKIETFESGWYRLDNYTVRALYLEDNYISNSTEILLNHLPRDIKRLSLRGNVIRTIRSGLIKIDSSLDVLDLTETYLSNIECDALRTLNITDVLYLNDNWLKDTRFMDSLPVGIKFLSLANNSINEISYGNFKNYTKFYKLDLSRNQISELPSGRLKAFSSLMILDLSYNRLRNIDPEFFGELENIRILCLESNFLKKFNGAWFQHIIQLESLSLASNGIRTIKKGAAKYLQHVSRLDLSHNPISVLRNGALCGLQKTIDTEITIAGVPVRMILSGLFDDVLFDSSI